MGECAEQARLCPAATPPRRASRRIEPADVPRALFGPLIHTHPARTTLPSLVIQDKNKYNAKKYRLVVRIGNKNVTCQVHCRPGCRGTFCCSGAGARVC